MADYTYTGPGMASDHGEYLVKIERRDHRCFLPLLETASRGSVWRCECSQKWKAGRSYWFPLRWWHRRRC